MPKIDFWMPLLDVEWEALRRADPELRAERRDGAWWLHVTGSGHHGRTEADARELVRLVIAEALAGHGLDKPPRAN